MHLSRANCVKSVNRPCTKYTYLDTLFDGMCLIVRMVDIFELISTSEVASNVVILHTKLGKSVESTVEPG